MNQLYRHNQTIYQWTFLFCEAWKGPTVLGFGGFLEIIRFAIDPDYEKIGCIYFSGTTTKPARF